MLLTIPSQAGLDGTPTSWSTEGMRTPPHQRQNPLFRARVDRGFKSRIEFAKYLNTSKQYIEQCENACFMRIPPKYHHLIKIDFQNSADQGQDPILAAEREYSLYRFEKRQAAFDPMHFPNPPISLENVLKHVGLNITEFAFRTCTQPIELRNVINNPKRIIPVNVVQAFVQIGLSTEWIAGLGNPFVRIRDPRTKATLTEEIKARREAEEKATQERIDEQRRQEEADEAHRIVLLEESKPAFTFSFGA